MLGRRSTRVCVWGAVSFNMLGLGTMSFDTLTPSSPSRCWGSGSGASASFETLAFSSPHLHVERHVGLQLSTPLCCSTRWCSASGASASFETLAFSPHLRVERHVGVPRLSRHWRTAHTSASNDTLASSSPRPRAFRHVVPRFSVPSWCSLDCSWCRWAIRVDVTLRVVVWRLCRHASVGRVASLWADRVLVWCSQPRRWGVLCRHRLASSSMGVLRPVLGISRRCGLPTSSHLAVRFVSSWARSAFDMLVLGSNPWGGVSSLRWWEGGGELV